MLPESSTNIYVPPKGFANRRGMPIVLLVLSLVMLSACTSLVGGRSDPPLPTIVPEASTATPSPAPDEIDQLTPIGVVSPPAPMPSSTPPVAEPSLTPAGDSAGDTAVRQPTDTPVLSTNTPVPTEPLPTATAMPAEPSVVPLESLNISLTPLASGLPKLTFLTHAADSSGRLFVVEQRGRILIIADGAVNAIPFLDITSLISVNSLEQGLLSVAFHPNYANNGLFFVNYTNQEGNTVVARYQVSDTPDLADPNSAKILLTIDQPYPNHNGGQLAFGPDGYLYVGMGDGGSANDPQNNGQTLNTLLGKILRLDVDRADPYGVPANNPFVNQGDARPEIWSYGWRNPWRFSFDMATGDMYAADVGQNQYEEVSVELAGTPGGQNYGWRLLEGFHCFDPAECDPGSLGTVLPVAEYDHNQGCSVTGGYVYRGERFPALTGIYFYGDFCSGIIWGLRREADGSWSQAELLQSGLSISSFGQDEAGELYVMNHDGDIFQIGN